MTGDQASPVVAAVAMRRGHRFSKDVVESIELVEGLGVAGDGHYGETVQHRSRRRWRPNEPNLRQVHLIAAETLAEARAAGFDVAAGDLGENILTAGLDVFALPTGARLRIGSDAVVAVTGLRNPCVQIDRFRDGLMAHFIRTSADGQVALRVGVMGVVVRGGVVRAGDRIEVALPEGEQQPLKKV